MLDGDGVRSGALSSGTPSVLELLDLVASLMGERSNFTLLLPPVRSLLNGTALPFRRVFCGVPVPTLVAASRAPLPPPVYVFGWGLGFTAGLEKADEAPLRAASRTLYCVSPVVCGTCDVLRVGAELIESPSDLRV
jgi:hypothetical protein